MCFKRVVVAGVVWMFVSDVGQCVVAGLIECLIDWLLKTCC